jgi:transposase
MKWFYQQKICLKYQENSCIFSWLCYNAVPVNIDLLNLPKDVNSLKNIIQFQVTSYEEIKRGHTDLESSHSTLRQSYTDLQRENGFLVEQVRHLNTILYGRKSEKSDYNQDQLYIFNEAEKIVATSAEEEKAAEITVPAHTRKKTGRRPLPADLPREVVVHDLKEEDKVCNCGANLSRIGEEVTEKLDIVPAKMRVIKSIRYKYACKSCEGVESEGGAVLIAPVAPQLIPQGIATEGLLAYILVAKYADALPLYRQEKIFERIGVDISRATMANWAIHVGQKCEPLMDLLWREIQSGPLINMDETPLQVLNEPGRSNTSKSYMWVFRGGDVERPALIFRYDPSRSGQFLIKDLERYAGYIQTDGYSGYNVLGSRDGIMHLGCWAHVRRKFLEVVKARPKGSIKRGYADVALTWIGQLYAIEKEADIKSLSVADRYQLRQEKSVPLLKQFKVWLDDISPKTPPQGLLGKAVSYTLNQWERLERYTQSGLLRPDNNLAENAIRPFVVGRKNWLFSATPGGATASATIYSLIETAKANGLEPYRYMRYMFERLPLAESESDYRALLPQYVDRNSILSMQL